MTQLTGNNSSLEQYKSLVLYKSMHIVRYNVTTSAVFKSHLNMQTIVNSITIGQFGELYSTYLESCAQFVRANTMVRVRFMFYG